MNQLNTVNQVPLVRREHVVKNAEQCIAAGSKSFAVASRLFTAHTRESAMMLYAWCRHCDDMIDGQSLGHGQRTGNRQDGFKQLELLEQLTRRAIAGTPCSNPVFIGLAEVIERHEIPAHYPLAHLAGYRMDVENTFYPSLGSTLDYCWRVAGVVGVMMSLVMGRRDAATLDRASDLGMAFQLTNIARDVVEDAAIDRVYLPQEWLQEEGIHTTAQILEIQSRASLSRVATRLVDAAEPYYRSAGRGIGALPLRSAWSVATARGVYRNIGQNVKARGASAWDQRMHSSRAAKLWFVARGAAVALTAPMFPASPRPSWLWTRPH